MPLRATALAADFPCWEDLPIDLPDDLVATYADRFENAPGFKLGGWPSLIQSEIAWAPYNRHPASPEYVFQLDSTARGNWTWGDNGTGYFGRGTAPGKEDEWALTWQSY